MKLFFSIPMRWLSLSLLLWALVTLSGAQTPGPQAPPKQPQAQQEARPEVAPPVVLEPPPILGPSPQPASVPPPILTAPPAPTPGFRGSSTDVIRVVIGLAVLFALAYLGGRPIVQRFEQQLGITQVVTAGLPFIFLGLIASRPGVGVLSQSILYELRPLLVLGLGWVGFAIGFRFDGHLIRSLWPGVGAVVALTAVWPFAVAVLLCGWALWLTEGSAGPVIFIRDAIILGAAGSMSAATASDLLRTRGFTESSIERLKTVVQLEELSAVSALMLVAAYFRSTLVTTSWQLPGTAWLFITVGMGATISAVIYPILNKIHSGTEFVVVMLGSICFTAGMASFLRLSPIVVCFIAGAILVNLPGVPIERIRDTLDHLERPIYLLFLIIAGSLWQFAQWEGWALMALFVVARLIGKGMGIWWLRKRNVGGLNPEERRSLLVAPLGALSIAMVVSAEDLYFSRSIPWIVTAVIGGAIITEIIVQYFTRGRSAALPV